MADALVKVAERALAHGDATGCGGERTQIFVHLDQDPLAPDNVLAATLDDGTRVSAETFRRLACDAALVPILHDTSGQTIDLGRRTRTISPALRRALWSRDRGCRYPSCPNKIYLHAHHIQHWAHGGETSAANLLLTCTHHHRLVHEGGFQLATTPAGDIIFKDPAGKPIDPSPAPHPITPDPFATVEHWNESSDLTIDALTGLTGWDGDPMDYDACVSAALGS